MDSYLKPSALKPTAPSTWYSPPSDAGATQQQQQQPPDTGPNSWQDRDVPENYVQIYQSTLNAGGLIDTAILYPILMTSGLPRELLGHVWSLANQKIPGQLIKPELFLALAMIGFVQSGNNPSDLSMFCQSPRPFPVILSIPAPVAAAAPQPPSAPPGHPLVPLTQTPSSVSVPHSAPPDSLSASSSVAALPTASLNYGGGVALPASSSSTSLHNPSTMIQPQHSASRSFHSTCLNPQPLSAGGTPLTPGLPAHPGPQSLTSAFHQEPSLASSHALPQLPPQPSEPVNHQNVFPLAQWETSSSSSVLAPCSSAAIGSHGFSASSTELRPTPSAASFTSGGAATIAASAPFSSASTTSCSSSLSFPPVFPAGVVGSSGPHQVSTSSVFPASSMAPLQQQQQQPPVLPVSSIAHPAPLLPTPLSAADTGDKYAAFKDLRAPEEEEDDFADFVVADVKEPEAAGPPLTPVTTAQNVFTPVQPTPVPPTKSVSATEKIIENLNHFSISSKSRKSSDNDDFAAFAPAESAPLPPLGTVSDPAPNEAWADFSQCFDETPASVGAPQQQQTLPQLLPQRLTQHSGVASEHQTSATEDFGDFSSIRGASLPRGASQAAPMRAQSAVAAPVPPPMSDGYHFSDPFFSPDNGLDPAPGGGFAHFNSKETTPTEGVMVKSALSAPYLDAVLSNGGMSRGSSIAAETQSVSSLELPAATCATSQSDSDSLNGQSTENNSVTSDDPGSGMSGLNGGLNGVTAQPQINGVADDYLGGGSGQPRKVSAAGLTSKQPLFGDRYSAVIEDVSASECLPKRWTECLQSCHR